MGNKSDNSIEAQVLYQLDHTWGILGAFSGDRDNCYPIEWRLTARRRDEDWAIVIERLTYSPQGVRLNQSVHAGIITLAFFWGNCLRYKWKPVWSALVQTLTSDPSIGRSFLETEGEPHPHVNPGVAAIQIRDQLVPLNVDAKSYAEMGIDLQDYPQIRPFEVLRALPLRYRERLLPTDRELSARFRKGAMPPAILTPDEWRNPLVNELPSKIESIRMIAEAIGANDPALYQPTELPNTHWSNWPKAGTYDTEFGPDIVPPNH